MAAPSSDFESADYPALRACSLAARGLWSDMRYLMRQSRRFGYLYQEGKPMSLRQLALTTGCTTDEARSLVQELIDAGLCVHHDAEGHYSPRMVAYESFRKTCATAGKKGGNPKLLKGSDRTLNRTPKGRSKGTPTEPAPAPPPPPSLSPTPPIPTTTPTPPPPIPPSAGGGAADPGVGGSFGAKGGKPATPQAEIVVHFMAGWSARYGGRYHDRPVDYAKGVELLRACGGCVEDAKAAVDRFLADDWPTVNRHAFATIVGATMLPKYLIPKGQAHAATGTCAPGRFPRSARQRAGEFAEDLTL